MGNKKIRIKKRGDRSSKLKEGRKILNLSNRHYSSLKSNSNYNHERSHQRFHISINYLYSVIKRSFRRNTILFFFVFAIIILFTSIWFFLSFRASKTIISTSQSLNKVPLKRDNNNLWGFDHRVYEINRQDLFTDKVGTPLSVLYRELPFGKVNSLSKELINAPLNAFVPKKKYTLLSKINGPEPLAMIVEVSSTESWVFGLGDSVFFSRIEKKKTLQTLSFGAIIEESLRKTLSSQILNASDLEKKIEDALAWSVDLYHLKPGTKIKILYDVSLVDEHIESIDTLKAISITTNEKLKIEAFYFEKGIYKGYYNEIGEPMKTTFLRAPVSYSHISSTFGLRLHPLENTQKFHFGTDYVARAGTPIFSVADGVVLEADYKKLNGYYVKIGHGNNQEYETFYLHMQRNSFPETIKKGAYVKQGDIIGLVGSTGSSTGPHVCFHLRHLGKPIDPLNVKLPSRKALPPSLIQSYFNKVQVYKSQLAEIKYLF